MDSAPVSEMEDEHFNDIVRAVRREAERRGLVFYLGPPTEAHPTSQVALLSRLGDLAFSRDRAEVFWKDKRVKLTLAEVKIVCLLVSQIGRNVPYREIFDAVRGPGVVAGSGPDGYKGNVRTFIKRIREKFTDVDSSFHQIATQNGIGYRWEESIAAEPAP